MADILDIGYVKNIIKEFDGKEIYTCRTCGVTGTGLNLNPSNLSFCHDAEISDKPREVNHICDISEFSSEVYYKSVYELINHFQDSEFACRHCSKCEKQLFKMKKISYVTINTSMYCNSKCIYCHAHTLKEGAWNPLPILEELHEGGCVEDDCYFDWGGGEPTKNPYFAPTVSFLYENHYMQRINTNAIDFSEETLRALKEGKAILRVSADSGTRDGYYRVKGTDNYNVFWSNIKKYCDASDDVYIKYNLFNENSQTEEIDGFLHQCERCGVKRILIDAEISAYQRTINGGPFYFTKREFDAVHELERKALAMGFEVGISEYAFGTRPNWDEESEKLLLPDVYFDNIDREVVSNGIFLKTFATPKHLVEIIQKHPAPVVVFGAGYIGHKVKKLFDKYRIQFELIDNKKEGYNEDFGMSIKNAERFLGTIHARDIYIVIAMRRFRDVLKQLNEMKINANVLWIRAELYDEAEYGEEQMK